MKTAHRQASHAKRRYTADPSAFFRTLGRAQPFTVDEQRELSMPVRIAFERMRTGAGTADDFATLAATANIAMVCAEKIDPLVEQACTTARDAILRIHERHQRLGCWGLDGGAFASIGELVDVYEQLTQLLTAGQLQEALEECHRRMRAGDYIEARHGH